MSDAVAGVERGMATAQAALGHGEVARREGVTRQYVSLDAPEGLWTGRREAPMPPPIGDEIQFAPSGPRPPLLKATPNEVDEVCAANSLDPRD